MVKIIIENLLGLSNGAKEILKNSSSKRILCFYGEMGAGKTTLIKAICDELGVKDNVASPTFAIINEYKDKFGDNVFHFDFYRINKIEEVYDFGYEEYFYNSNGLCLIEWPELVEDILPTDNVCKLKITVNPDNSRVVEVSG